jgi:signal transduction histidine kinase
MPGAGGRVCAEISRHGKRGCGWTCATPGPGIPREDRERIFEMFYTTRPQGTGLGLFLARTAVEQNGGTLAVADPDGAGARMRMEFPVAEKEPA